MTLQKFVKLQRFLIGVNVQAREPTKKMTLQFTKTREGTVRVKTGTSATI